MATRFEIVLHGENPSTLRAAGEEALDEIDRIEAQLSLYRPGSEVARLNAEAHERAMRVTPGLFRLLEHARELTRETHGAFDLTIAPLVRCWGFMGGTGAMPEPAAIEEARAKVGMQHVELDAAKLTVRFTRPGVMLDFGAIGKGYAVDRAVELLREAGVGSALLHGGTSTAYALGRPPLGGADVPSAIRPASFPPAPKLQAGRSQDYVSRDGCPTALDGARWKIAITSPGQDQAKPLAVVELENESLSVSAVWGRSFRAGEKNYGHILDPRTGAPATSALLSAVVLPHATETDALSTALLTAPELMSEFVSRRPALRCLVASVRTDALSVSTHGLRVL